MRFSWQSSKAEPAKPAEVAKAEAEEKRAASKKFEVRLVSQTDEHFRLVSLRAADAAEARAVCEQSEADLVAVSLSDEQLAALEAEHRYLGVDSVGDDGRHLKAGKVVGPDPHARALLHAHYQSKPYLVADVTEKE
jgi:hypothetical protein